MSDNQSVPGIAEQKATRRRQMGCIWIALAMAGLLLLVTIYVFTLWGASLRVSEETTYITEPLKSDGKRVDYFAAWEQETYPPNIATEENGYRLIVQHLGNAPEAPPHHAAEIRRKLGLPEELEPDMNYQDPEDFWQAYLDSDECDEAMLVRLIDEVPCNDPQGELRDRIYRPWTSQDLPAMEKWLRKNNAAIDIISEAVRKPVFRIPMARTNEDDQLLALLLPELQQTRAFARGLSVRANHRIGTGDIDGAIEDIVACRRLGRQIGPGGSLIHMLVGIACEGIACSIGIAGSLEHLPTKDQLQRLAANLEVLPPPAAVDEAMRFERYTALDIVQDLSMGKVPLNDWETLSQGPSWLVDWNVVAKRINEYYDALPSEDEFTRWAGDWRAIVLVKARSEWVAKAIASIMLPGLEVVDDAFWRRTCVDRLQQITLAMLLYECDHGTLPPAYAVDGNGDRLHSWRVLLLPYLGRQELYDKIRLDEPWNSEHNRQFHKQAVEFYQCPGANLEPGKTTYSVVVGPEMPFEGSQGKQLADFGPKSAKMILVVERSESVCWMDPTSDVPQTEADMGIKGDNVAIGDSHRGGSNFGFRDGVVLFLSDTIDTELFGKLLRGTADTIP